MPTRRALLAAAVTAASLAGCSQPKPRTPGKAPTKVTYLTGFQNTPREQYARVAQAKGYFAEVGLDVTIQPGKPGDFNFIQMELGHAQFSSVDFVSAAKYLLPPGRYHYQVIAAIQQRTLLGLASLKTRNITRASDLLASRTIGTAQGGAIESMFPVYAKLAGLNICPPAPASAPPGCLHITWRYPQPDQVVPYLGGGAVDLIGTYVCDTPNTEAAVGPINVLPYSLYLEDLLGTVVVASSTTIASQPEVVRRFAAAIVKGTVYACTNPQEAGQILARTAPPTKAGPAGQVYALMAPYLSAAGAPGQPLVGPGTLNPGRVMRGISLLTSSGVIPQGSLTPQRLCAFDLSPKAA